MLEDTSHASTTAGADVAPIHCALMGAPAGGPVSPDAEGLIDLIVTRYHDTHRREFPVAIQLARKVEATHPGDAECPRGLADHLAMMFDELESHQRREEQVLFPMILGGGSRLIRFPIGRMMAEHAQVEEQLVRLRALTRDFSGPPGACGSWKTLMSACRKLDSDLREHMRLENEVLFAPFLY